MSLKELTNNIKGIQNALSEVSDTVIYLENTLRKEKFHIPYAFEIDGDNEYVWMLWDYELINDKKKNWRLFLAAGDIDKKKAFMETPINTRLKYCCFLDDFISGFTQETKSLLQTIRATIKKENRSPELEKQVLLAPDASDFEHPDDLPY